jgi:hypothetical protein
VLAICQRFLLNPLVPEPASALELTRAPASKCARAGKLRTGRIGIALQIDAQHVIFPGDYITIGLSNRLHFLIPFEVMICLPTMT